MTTPITEPLRPRSTITCEPRLYTCTPQGEKLVDITKWMLSGSVTVNFLNEIKTSGKFKLRKGAPVRAIVDCIMPCITLTWRDGRGVLRKIEDEPLAVLYFLPADEEITELKLDSTIDGMDTLWRLSQLTSNKLLWFGEGKDYGEAAYETLAGASPVKLSIPKTSTKIVKPYTVLPNAYILKAANDMLMGAGYWDASATRTGTVTTSQRTVLGQSNPARIIDSRLGDVLATQPIQRRPDRGAFCNQVMIASNSPEAPLDLRNGYKVSLIDPKSPYNIYSSPVVSRRITDSRDESFQTVRNRAIMMLEAAAGMQRRITIPCWPDPRFNAREAWQVNIFQRDGFAIMDGMARVEELTFGFTQNSFAQVATLSELADINQVVEGEVA